MGKSLIVFEFISFPNLSKINVFAFSKLYFCIIWSKFLPWIIKSSISSILSKTDIHVTVVKGYLLPKTVNGKTLVVCTSISGDTKETLSVLENSKKTQI